MKSTTEYGYAKINLALDVTGVRENGYHDVRMIMQSVDLHDALKLTKTDTPGITLSVGTAPLPAGPGNLVYDAAKLLFDRFELSGGVLIELDKCIPCPQVLRAAARMRQPRCAASTASLESASRTPNCAGSA